MKFKFLSIFFILNILLVSSSYATAIVITQSTTVVDDAANNVNPGDTLFLEGGVRDYILFKNLHGSELAPIVIINKNDQVRISTSHFYAIKFDQCSHIKLSGNYLESIEYGIKIVENTHTNGTGITVDNYSTNVEIEFVEIGNIPIAGIYMKTDPFFASDCSYASRDNFVMRNMSIHDCYLHDIEDEGMYIGSSKYTGTSITGSTAGYNDHCGTTTVLPHIIEGIRVYNNIIENTGWDGIQVSSATEECYIYNNLIRNDSYRETQFQMSGILIGGGSNCDCYNNKIYDGKGDGIDILGLGNHKIYNNLIVRAGKTYHPTDSPVNFQKHGIWAGDVSTNPGTEMLIYNNTIISPRSFGLKLTNTNITSHKAYNNLIVNPGLFELLGENAFVNISGGVSYVSTTNYYTNNISEVLFINTALDNYDLQGLSPAVNAGTNLLNLGLSFDINDRIRPFAGAFDIGAYESSDQVIGIEELTILKEKVKVSPIIPNPIRIESNFTFEVTEPMHIRIFIVNQLGMHLKTLFDQQASMQTNTLNIKASSLASGLYFLIIESPYGRYSKKLVIL